MNHKNCVIAMCMTGLDNGDKIAINVFMYNHIYISVMIYK